MTENEHPSIAGFIPRGCIMHGGPLDGGSVVVSSPANALPATIVFSIGNRRHEYRAVSKHSFLEDAYDFEAVDSTTGEPVENLPRQAIDMTPPPAPLDLMPLALTVGFMVALAILLAAAMYGR